MRVLLCEDEMDLSNALVAILKYSNYSVDVAYDGEEALACLCANGYDAIILDIMMPKMDGLCVLKKLRQKGDFTPVLVLTAKAEIDDKVAGLDLGANDYLTKPFATKELLARIRAMTRPQQNASSVLLTNGNITLNRLTFELHSPDGTFKLANKEFQMMELLMMNSNQLLSTECFMEKIWGYESNSEINVVWVYISYLRKKLSALHANIYIKATRNAGYSLESK